MTTMARGVFEVRLRALEPYSTGDSKLGRMALDKEFHGDLEGMSKGEMLSARTDIKESAGYVAIERITGTLAGRRGSFVLQHSATMTRGLPAMSVAVVPDSGTGALAGLTGSMTIDVHEGRHSYELSYDLPDA
jgi:hypothetical protein